MARHLAPFSCRQRIAVSVRRRSRGGVLPLGRHCSTSGSSRPHCVSVSIAPPHLGRLPGKEQNAIPVKRFKVEQALALQLQEPAFEVSLLCGGLMSAPPSRPTNDEGWLNAPLRQSDRYAPDFLHRPGNRQAWR